MAPPPAMAHPPIQDDPGDHGELVGAAKSQDHHRRGWVAAVHIDDRALTADEWVDVVNLGRSRLGYKDHVSVDSTRRH